MTQIFQTPNNITTPIQSLSYINNLTDVGMGPMLGTIIYFILVAAMFLGMKSFSNDRAAAAALFIASIIGILLRIFGWLNDFSVYLSLMLLVFSLFKLWDKND